MKSKLLFFLSIVFLNSCNVTTPHPANPINSTNKSSYLGINAHWDYHDSTKLESVMSDLHAMGVGMLRIDWEWRSVEVTPGVYDWTKIDRLMALAHKYEIDIYPMVHYPPTWATAGNLNTGAGHQQEPPTPAHYDEYAAFVLKSIQRYGPSGNFNGSFKPISEWEIWNEPNLDQFWSPTQNFAQYALLLKTTSDVIKANPLIAKNVKIVHAGIASADWLWLWQCYNANPSYGDNFDILSVHPYYIDINSGPRDITAMDADDPTYSPLGFIGSISDTTYYGKVYNLRNLMHLMGDANPDKPIWVTEVGAFVGNTNPASTTESGQSEVLANTVKFTKEKFGTTPYLTYPHAVNVQKIFWFNYQDYADDSLPGSWGLVNLSGQKRSSYDKFKSLLTEYMTK